MMKKAYRVFFILFIFCFSSACSCDRTKESEDALEEGDAAGDPGQDMPGDVVNDTPHQDVDQDDTWWSDGCSIFYCQAPHVYQCGDCEDNDTDGQIDSKDSHCLGPCDNNENGYNTEIPGGNSAPCKQDCYFDQDSGAGNDDCYWDHRCDDLQPLELNPCNYENPCDDCECDSWYETQSSQCLDICLPLVPNGCDCFGCCELGGDGQYVFIGSPGCNLDERDKCTPCTYVPSCYNDCGRCEICLGKTELPPDCFPEDRCPPGVQACGLPEDPPCPDGYYCITGCCREIML